MTGVMLDGPLDTLVDPPPPGVPPVIGRTGRVGPASRTGRPARPRRVAGRPARQTVATVVPLTLVLVGVGALAAGGLVALAPPLGVAVTTWLLVLGSPGRPSGGGRLVSAVVAAAVVVWLGDASGLARWAPPDREEGHAQLALVVVLMTAGLLARGVVGLAGLDRPRERLLVVGTSRFLVRHATSLGRAGHDAVLHPGDAAWAAEQAAPEEVARRAAAVGATVVLVDPAAGWTGPQLRRLGWHLQRHTRARLALAVDVDGLVLPGATRAGLGELGAITVRLARPGAPARRLVALVERPVAAAGLLVLAPLLVLVGVAVRCTSPGPALFRQQRIGREGAPFTLLKFRTMHRGAPPNRSLVALDDAGGTLFKIRADPRVTPLGRVLRRYSVDELPQLVNVVRGEMSLVGPRPALPEEVARYDRDTHRRLAVRPGLTGQWQVSGRSDLTSEQAVRLDLQYVDNWSPLLDARILVRTVGAVVGHRGAY